MQKPELLLPAGSTEAFYAALDGGADAIYLGLQDFNARKGAHNFTINQLPLLLKLAHNQNTKIYITLNTVIKNTELANLIILLSQLNNFPPDAIIIQDWGLFYLAKKYFPNLHIHASTQMAFHNSAGANFAAQQGIERVILARELTFKELYAIRSRTKTELELFVHGALCYSFSGMCLFSSYLGGQSANRGACKQPCRRMFKDNKKKHFLFSLKDNELIEYVPDLIKLGITSLKIEGRMKSADYVYTIARAYRMALDNPERVKEAKEILSKDLGREKTSYFMGGKLNNALTESPNTGLYIGDITLCEKNEFSFELKRDIDFNTIRRLRIVSPDGKLQQSLKVRDAKKEGQIISIPSLELEIKPGYKVFVLGFDTKKFPSRLTINEDKNIRGWNKKQALQKSRPLNQKKTSGKPCLYFRIDDPVWLKKIRLENIDKLILNFSLKSWQEINLDSPFLKKNKQKMIAALPGFISEENWPDYQKLTKNLVQQGLNNFQINHISQRTLIPKNCNCIASEYMYTFNDASIAQLNNMGISQHIFPFENDLENLISGEDRLGIVPLHFTPQLFYSRMPAKVFNEEGAFKDDNELQFRIVKKAGTTITIPTKPVSLFQNKPQLTKNGFRNFLIDVSYTHPSQNTFKTLIKRYYQSEQFQPSTSFNFKKGLS